MTTETLKKANQIQTFLDLLGEARLNLSVVEKRLEQGTATPTMLINLPTDALTRSRTETMLAELITDYQKQLEEL